MKKELITAFFLQIFLISCIKKKNADLNVVFDRVDNIVVGSEVKMNGYTVGKVNGLKLLNNGVLVGIKLTEKIHISSGSEFFISSPLVGASSVNIKPSSTKSYLSNKDTVPGKFEEKGLLDSFISDSANRKKIQDALTKIAEGIKELLEARKDSTRQ